jgi:hypothetical protein
MIAIAAIARAEKEEARRVESESGRFMLEAYRASCVVGSVG